MSKVKIKGNASGTGVLTIEAPNTNTDRTITLPDEDITLGGGVDGIVSTANATAITIDSSENVVFSGTITSSATNTSGSGWGIIPYVANSLVIDNIANQTRFFATGADATTDGSFKFYTSQTDGGTNERLEITSDGRGLSQFTAKCWVNLNGTGTIAINDSHNVSSLIDVGVGQYEVVFSNAMSNANYSATSSNNGWGLGGTTNVSTAKFKCVARDYQFNIADVSVMMAQVFGD